MMPGPDRTFISNPHLLDQIDSPLCHPLSYNSALGVMMGQQIKLNLTVFFKKFTLKKLKFPVPCINRREQL
jgi:hypothetical protein